MKEYVVCASLGLALAVAPAVLAQDPPQKMDKADKMNMSNMSADDKAAAFDKMSEKHKMAALKMSGHDMAGMSATDKMNSMSKLTNQDKAAAYDKHMANMKMHK